MNPAGKPSREDRFGLRRPSWIPYTTRTTAADRSTSRLARRVDRDQGLDRGHPLDAQGQGARERAG